MAEDNIIGNISEGNASSAISSITTSLKMDNLSVTTDSKGKTTIEEAVAHMLKISSQRLLI